MKKLFASLLSWAFKSQNLDGIRCRTCTNRFWIEDADIEPPFFCPFCGIKFTGRAAVSDERFNDLGN